MVRKTNIEVIEFIFLSDDDAHRFQINSPSGNSHNSRNILSFFFIV